MPAKLKTDFEIPADTHTVLVVVPHYWGRGKTKEEAMVKCKEQGGRPGKTGYVAYYFGKGFAEDTGWVDDFGSIHWEWDEESLQVKRGDRPLPVKEERLAPSILRA